MRCSAPTARKRSTAFRASITAPRAWAAATCGPATSSPPCTTCKSPMGTTSSASASITRSPSNAAKIPICARSRLLDARPFRRRLRQRHHQQDHRHHRRQHFRQRRTGVSEVRLREEGLADTYYLTIGDSHIYMHSELEHIDLLCINDPTAFKIRSRSTV